MLLKSSLLTCVLAATAVYACAQEAAPKGAQPGTQKGGDTQNRRVDSPAQPSDAQNPSDVNRKRNRTEEARPGQDVNRNQRDATTRTTETRETRSSDKPLDTAIATCLLLGNQKEVSISQFAAERAKNEKVKEFARQMVKDHSQAITMLQRFAGPHSSQDLGSIESTRTNRSETTVKRSTTTADTNRSSAEGERRDANSDAKNLDSNPSAGNQKAERRTNERRPDGSDQQPGAVAGQNEVVRDRPVANVEVRTEHEAIPDKMFAIEREITQKCLAMAKQELEQSSNFDQAYVGMQISEHMGMIAKLETFKSYASEDLGKVIQESLSTAQGHFRHAKELVTEIGSHSSSSTRGDAANRSDATNRSDTGTRRDSDAKRNKDSSKD